MSTISFPAKDATGASVSISAEQSAPGQPISPHSTPEIGGAPVTQAAPMPTKAGSSGALTDASTTITGASWSQLSAVAAGRSMFFIQNRDLAYEVDVVLAAVAPTAPAGTSPAGAILLPAKGRLGSADIGGCPSSGVWVRATDAAATGVPITAKFA